MNKKLDDYKGGNPDSREAYFSVDVSGPENEDVIVDRFIWNRKKSNENLSDPRQGKGFSFYLARHVFDDDFNCDVYNEQNPDNVKKLGIVYRNVVVVIYFEFEDDKIRIISSWEEEEDSTLSKIYWRNRYKIERQEVRTYHEDISSKKQSRFISDEDKNIVYEFITKKLQERLFGKAYLKR